MDDRSTMATTSDDRSMALIAHLSTLVATIISVGWLSFVGPLVVVVVVGLPFPTLTVLVVVTVVFLSVVGVETVFFVTVTGPLVLSVIE